MSNLFRSDTRSSPYVVIRVVISHHAWLYIKCVVIHIYLYSGIPFCHIWLYTWLCITVRGYTYIFTLAHRARIYGPLLVRQRLPVTFRCGQRVAARVPTWQKRRVRPVDGGPALACHQRPSTLFTQLGQH